MFRFATAIALSAAFFACTGEVDDRVEQPPPTVIDDDTVPPGNASGGSDNTWDHPNSITDPWELLDRMQREGPPRYSSRVHSCPKMKYATIGRVLASRGVDLGSSGETQAGFMWATSGQALGAPNYGARAAENLDLTTASASKLFDIFVQAAPEIIATMQDQPQCTVGGVGASMFNASGQCSADGITCLIGMPATPGHIELCNEMIGRATTPEKGRIIAVAALAAAAHTCE